MESLVISWTGGFVPFSPPRRGRVFGERELASAKKSIKKYGGKNIKIIEHYKPTAHESMLTEAAMGIVHVQRTLGMTGAQARAELRKLRKRR